MPQVLFTLLAMLSGASISSALFVVWCHWRAGRRDPDKKRNAVRKRLSFTMLGVAGTYAILLSVVIPSAQVTPSGRAWAYMGFLFMTAVGLIGLAEKAADSVAEIEARVDETLTEQESRFRREDVAQASRFDREDVAQSERFGREDTEQQSRFERDEDR